MRPASPSPPKRANAIGHPTSVPLTWATSWRGLVKSGTLLPMSDRPLNFEEHRRRRDENASTVRCVRCGKWIAATVTRCPECGVNFQGEAQDFIHPSEQPDKRGGRPIWVIVLAVVLLAAMAFAVLR